MVINVLDIVPACNTAPQGQAIADAVRRALRSRHIVTLSFAGVTDVPSSFVNASIVALFHDRGIDEVRDRLMISNVTGQISAMIRRCLANSQRNNEAA